ncbi:hypothetical protein EV361DRAFT_942517 [Lentinula raphanica]|nr:hypothetical protein EV361DRAFT_942517 [Lentinula raphanica]
MFYLSAEEVSSLLSSTTPGTLIALDAFETLTLLGTYRLTVVQGSVQIGGAILRSRIEPETRDIFAPRSSPLPSIRALSSSSSHSAQLPTTAQNTVRDKTLLLLQELRTGVEGLGKVCRTFDAVFDIHPRDMLSPQDLDEQHVLRLQGVRIINQQTKYLSPLDMPSSWDRALDGVHLPTENTTDNDSPPNIYLVTGPKKVGKSSFARALSNRLLSRPLPSYPFSGNTIISASGNAIISVSYAPQNQFPVQIHPIEPVPIPDSSSSVIPSYLSSYTAADHRAISIMSYFHAIFPSSPSPDYPRFHDSPFPSSVTASTWDTSLPLLARPPYQVDVERAIDRVFLRGVGEAGEVVQEEIERVLGGAVISLISCESGTLDDLTLSHSKRQVTKIPYIPSASPASYPSPSNSTAIGLALIRSVVPGGMHLHVLTPLPLNVIETARVIIKGEMELPIWGFVDSRNTGTRKERGSGGARGGDNEDNVHREVPFLQWDRVVGLGAEKRRVRRNLMRKGQGV